MVRVEAEVVTAMFEHACQQSPLESCGLLTRSRDVIDGVRHCTNELQSATRFSIPAAELFQFFRKLRSGSDEFAGIYHSHPGSPTEPSPTDVEEFHYITTNGDYCVAVLKKC